KLYLLFFIVFIIYPVYLSAQEKDYQIGLDPNFLRTQSTGGYYDFSDPNGINIKVAVWGYVKFPGRYVIPVRSDIKDLISYAGGINDNAYLDDLRIYRIDKDSTQLLLIFNYEDLWWGETLTRDINLSRLQAGDVLIVPGRPRLYWESYFTLVLSSLGLIISIATLILVTAN
ncbi:SLBB domain-containing protein, partial [Bacteroidota bacterium]